MALSQADRTRLIRETLDTDRHINLQVVNLNKKALEKYNDTIAPVPTNNQELLTNIDIVVEKLLSLLQNKIKLLDNLPTELYKALSLKTFSETQSFLSDISNVNEVITLYNSIVRVLNAPSTMTQQTRMILTNKISTILASIEDIMEKLEKLSS